MQKIKYCSKCFNKRTNTKKKYLKDFVYKLAVKKKIGVLNRLISLKYFSL